MQKIRILLVDYQALVRAGLRLLLEAEPDIQVVGEAPNSLGALAQARETIPDIVLLKIGLPGFGGFTVIEQLRHQCPRTRVLVLSVYADEVSVRSVLAAGSSAYVSKHAAPADLLTAIRSVAQGHSFVDPTLADLLLHDRPRTHASVQAASRGRPRSLLSQREREVLIRLGQGYTNRQTAEQIHVSVKSVETYRARIAQKLELHSRADLIRYAHVSGLLTPEMFPMQRDKSA
jgi:two-component system, NarL family, response regulator NreC